MFGREVRAPLDVVMGLPMSTEQSSVSIDEFVEGKVERMRAAYRSVRENPGKSAERQKRYYDFRVKPASFQSNDQVWLWSARRRQGISSKWQRRYIGPYTVVEQVGPVDYRIRRSAKSKGFIVHVDKLRPYLSPAIPEGRMTPSNAQGVPSADEVASMDDDATTESEFEGRPHRARRLPARYRN